MNDIWEWRDVRWFRFTQPAFTGNARAHPARELWLREDDIIGFGPTLDGKNSSLMLSTGRDVLVAESVEIVRKLLFSKP